MSKDYSVVIRTLGNGGEKYKKLINSIAAQTIAPKEIIVVLPYDYELDYSLGNEKIIFSEKGMVVQRITGINNAQTEFILVVDDDVAFDDDFVEKLFVCVEKTGADLISPTNGELEKWHFSFKNTVNKNIKILKHILLGNRFIHFNPKYAVKIVGTGGHSILNKIDKNQYYLTQSGNFQCFFMKTDCAKQLNYEEERWLEDTGYAIFDDQVFFYKAFILNQKVIFAPGIPYLHLDGGKGHIKRVESERLYRKLYGNTRNKTIFWKKFLYNRSCFVRKAWLIFCYLYSFINTLLVYILGNLFKPKSWSKTVKAVTKGMFDGLNYKLLK